jgi:oligopeptide transport system substrate-binding protein
MFLTACSELEKPKPAPFYAETAPPAKKEFRWSNGKTPKSFDPAKASAPPETDVARAVFEGLTETDPVTLKPIPAIAESWTSSQDNRAWTFNLRQNAKWSNGKSVTAHDFVNSWKRAAEMNEPISHRNLLQNIVGMPVKEEKPELPAASPEMSDFLLNQLSIKKTPTEQVNSKSQNQTNSNSTPVPPKIAPKESDAAGKTDSSELERKSIDKKNEIKFGVEAAGDYVLKVSLINSDKDFPSLVAHPIFRPIFGDGKDFEAEKLNAGIVTNGAFRIVSVGHDGVTLDRAENYWNKKDVNIERVRFVPTESAEKALEAYRAGEIDAVTNADFAPLALKLLTPYDDFRQTTHSALNFYEFNRAKPAFADRRVREAMAISIEREHLTEGDLEGASEPAFGFSPFQEPDGAHLSQNPEKAKQLLADAGFPNGENFPVIKLVVNRNDLQQRVARSVAKMWKKNLNVETEIVIKDAAEFEAARKSGDFDLIRRGVVLPTTDAAVNMLTIFEPHKKIVEKTETSETPTENNSENAPETDNSNTSRKTQLPKKEATEMFESANGALILTEAEAIAELSAIPLYFPTSYSLVKPYILGFETNTLDAPLLREVRIDNAWQPKENKGESK